MRCTERAYAKINLTLDVGTKRADGYHEITSVMQRISLWDTVTVERGTGCDSLLCSVPVTEDVNDNLCMKALRVFFTETAMESGGVSITLEKHIPTQAGLGGGSSDAAAVLLALRTLYAPRMTDMRLERLAEKLGSDVPFFIRGGTQLAEGRGEKLTVLKPAPRFFVAVCKPDFPISTPALFARVDGVTITDRPDTDAMLAAIEHGDTDTLCANVRNVFEQALDGEQRERIETIKRDLLAYGAKTSAMTGSGSVVFGLFSDKAACRRACEALQGECVKTFCAEFV